MTITPFATSDLHSLAPKAKCKSSQERPEENQEQEPKSCVHRGGAWSALKIEQVVGV